MCVFFTYIQWTFIIITYLINKPALYKSSFKSVWKHNTHPVDF
jgi:hypothetical protein